jgi:hypothetical protein
MKPVVMGLVAMLWLGAPGASAAASVETLQGLRVVRLSGTPYEMGRQHGSALREEVQACVRELRSYFRSYLKVPGLRALIVAWWLDTAWRQARPFVPPRYLEELRGLSDAAQVPLRELTRMHAIPDRTYSCANFAAWGAATADGRLLHLRNLDWNIRAGLQRHAVVFVVHPEGQRAYVSMGWAGFIGVLTGVNEAQLSIGQVGAETTDVTYRGEPMAFLMRRVLEEAGDVDSAARVVQEARRTVGVNYVVADSKARRAIAMETTRRYFRAFEANDRAEQGVDYARPMADAVLRADTAIDPVIRERQIASRGNPRQPGLEPPGGSAYTTRYVGQAEGLAHAYGTLDVAGAQAIARAIAPDSNVQSVIFAWPEAWVANAQGHTPAAQSPYQQLPIAELLAAGPE